MSFDVKLLLTLLVICIFVCSYFFIGILDMLDEQSTCISKSVESGYTLDEAKDKCKR